MSNISNDFKLMGVDMCKGEDGSAVACIRGVDTYDIGKKAMDVIRNAGEIATSIGEETMKMIKDNTIVTANIGGETVQLKYSPRQSGKTRSVLMMFDEEYKYEYSEIKKRLKAVTKNRYKKRKRYTGDLMCDYYR